jgi:hypothetical protein
MLVSPENTPSVAEGTAMQKAVAAIESSFATTEQNVRNSFGNFVILTAIRRASNFAAACSSFISAIDSRFWCDARHSM